MKILDTRRGEIHEGELIERGAETIVQLPWATVTLGDRFQEVVEDQNVIMEEGKEEAEEKTVTEEVVEEEKPKESLIKRAKRAVGIK